MTDLEVAFLRWSDAEQDFLDANGVLTYAIRAPLSVSYQSAQVDVVNVLQGDALKRRSDYDNLAGERRVDAPLH